MTNEVTARCTECDDELRPQTDKERVCDRCAEVAKMTDQQVKDLEFKLAHGVLMSRDEWELSIHLVNTITGRDDVISDEEYEVYAAEV